MLDFVGLELLEATCFLEDALCSSFPFTLVEAKSHAERLIG